MTTLKPSILVVEDNPLAQKMASIIIEPLGYHVDIAATGLEAIEKFKRNVYHFIFMDIGLPDMQGYQVTESIRALETGDQPLPIVALTVHLSSECQQKAKDAGMNDFLTKPFSTEKANAILKQYINLDLP
jgi:CheY-like chemotaxis protein